MSLNQAQRRRTATEFQANLAAAGLTTKDLRERTGLEPARFVAAFDVTKASDPADVWLLRDTLEQAVRERAGSLTPYSVLTERMRPVAGGWPGAPGVHHGVQ